MQANTNKPSHWLLTHTRRWSVTIRFLIGLIVTEILLVPIVAFIIINGYQLAGYPLTELPPEMTNLLIGQVLAITIAFFATATVAGFLILALNRRITDITDFVEERTASGKLNLKLREHPREDEVGRLVKAINRLSAANQEAVEAMTQRATELATLNLVAETVNRTLDLQQVFDTSLRETLRTVGWEVGAIYMWDERIALLNMVSYVGLDEEVIRDAFSCELDKTLTGKAAKQGKLLIANRSTPSGDAMGGLRITQISIPLMTVPGNQLLGVLSVGSNHVERPSDNDIRLLTTIAHQVASAIDKAQLYTQVSQHAEELERIVEARTQQLAHLIEELTVALERAQEADKVKSLLLTTVSHELRTPLATIKGNTSLLQAHHQQLSAEALTEHLQDIDEETDKLTEMISSLLEMSRIEGGILHIQPQDFDLSDILESTVNSARVRHVSHNLALDVVLPLPSCYGDARRVEQIVANLINNAAKYSPAGTWIRVRARHDVKDGELIVSVEDEGQGISDEHQEHIFDRFYRIDQSRADAKRDGIGLGLAICRGLVEAHGGRIWVESRLGVGSTFSFSLPTARIPSVQESIS
ncbi:MAG: GAF domain-containing protein [Chloroflexi bacterium]|nr:GAF domain-containing protein [Chloroflexota bacterium]